MDQRPGAHQTRFDGDVEIRARQSVVADSLGRVPERGDLGVGGRIVAPDRAIEAGAQDFPSAHHDSTHGHLAVRPGTLGQFKRAAHPVLV